MAAESSVRWLDDVQRELGVFAADAIEQQGAESRVRPSFEDELHDEVQIGAWLDVVRDARRDDREDVRGALAADISPREEPILSSEDELSQLAFASVVRELDVAVVEEEDQARPLSMQVTKRLAERRLGRDHCSLLVDPRAQSLEHRRAVLESSRLALLGVV